MLGSLHAPAIRVAHGAWHGMTQASQRNRTGSGVVSLRFDDYGNRNNIYFPNEPRSGGADEIGELVKTTSKFLSRVLCGNDANLTLRSLAPQDDTGQWCSN